MPLPKTIQIEVTTACQLGCVFCPHTVMSEHWVTARMSWEVFSSILPYVRPKNLVHLQGWGEPLLHPRIWDMAAAIRQRRSRVSLTTNAMLLDQSAAREACKLGIDVVGVSMAGARAETNDLLRAGSQFDRICSNVSYLCGLKPRPRVHLVMQMMKPNISELPELVTLAARLGADEVIAPNLDYTPSEHEDALKIFDRPANSSYLRFTEEAFQRGKALGIKVHVYPLEPRDDVLVCDADPIHQVWISVSGEVAPCPYLGFPYSGRIPRLFRGGKKDLKHFTFGNVMTGLDRVLEGEVARSFRQAFSRRLVAGRLGTIGEVDSSSLPRVASSSVNFLESLVHMAYKKGSAALPQPPQVCRNCYKLDGL